MCRPFTRFVPCFGGGGSRAEVAHFRRRPDITNSLTDRVLNNHDHQLKTGAVTLSTGFLVGDLSLSQITSSGGRHKNEDLLRESQESSQIYDLDTSLPRAHTQKIKQSVCLSIVVDVIVIGTKIRRPDREF